MTPKNPIQQFYTDNPRMVSSPFGGIDDINHDLLQTVLKTLNIPLKQKKVLDIGCGRGYAADLVQQQGGYYIGADFVCSRSGFPLTLADAAQLPFADSSFDSAFCIDASEHFPEPKKAAREVFRILKPGGTFFLSAPNYANTAGFVKWYCEYWGAYEKHTWAPFGRWQAQEHEYPLTPAYLKRLYRQAGLKHTHHIGFGAEVGLGLFPWLDHPRIPEAIQFRLQRLFKRIGPAIARVYPASSLHIFWNFKK